jgi:beta-galactosidase GanA
MNKIKKIFLPVGLLCLFFYSANSQVLSILPVVVKKDAVSRLSVDGKPFLILGGETGNASASGTDYMRPCWAKFQSMNLNTVLAPVFWELMEPEEGKFDFLMADSLINNTRAHKLKLVLLWFGTWKNSMSCYTPPWIKKNPAKFARVQDNNNRSMEIISAFSKDALDADKKAYAAVMKHIKETDEQQHTVIMVQVENEIGMLSTAREISGKADSYFSARYRMN